MTPIVNLFDVFYPSFVAAVNAAMENDIPGSSDLFSLKKIKVSQQADDPSITDILMQVSVPWHGLNDEQKEKVIEVLKANNSAMPKEDESPVFDIVVSLPYDVIQDLTKTLIAINLPFDGESNKVEAQ